MVQIVNFEPSAVFFPFYCLQEGQTTIEKMTDSLYDVIGAKKKQTAAKAKDAFAWIFVFCRRRRTDGRRSEE